MTDRLKALEDSIESVRRPRNRPNHEILDMYKVFAVIDECHQLREEVRQLRDVNELGKPCMTYSGRQARKA